MDADSKEFMRELLLRPRAEMRAQREALFRLFNRLDEGGSAAGA